MRFSAKKYVTLCDFYKKDKKKHDVSNRNQARGR